ncbi:hypothetical protein [Streptomyces sp. ALI-76-A]|uniref:hypothetical protein n=1 Tax=Streptomyces sp. ALI-76-A TaxID=3025736 RepID=UPI00256F529E|nr:hypothetical protein [Streptomyces sp. ALI-76-A]MDL5200219.1 hypothetical protein [Streptomyces sp. ALI-76-A]
MLRIHDVRTGKSVEAAPARRGLTRVEAHTAGRDPSALRVLLVADILIRALELGGTPVWAVLNGDRRPELRAATAALGIRPFEDDGEAGAGLGEAQVIHVVGEGADTGERGTGPDTARPASVTAGADAATKSPGGLRVSVASVDTAGAGIVEGADGMPEGADPAVVRLALLSRRRSVPVRLDAEALEEARDTLARWRRAVAGWARLPSRAVPEEVRTELRAAWEDDLDVPAVLRVLRRVETSDLPEGARFETYAYADRLLGLELTRDLGAPA